MHRRLALVAAVPALLATACIRVDYDIEVNGDGSGTVSGIVAVQTDALSGMGDMFGDLGEELGADSLPTGDLCDQFREQNAPPEGVESEPYEEDGYCGYRFSGSWEATDDPAAEIAAVLGDDDTTGSNGDGDGEVVLQEEPGGGWRFEAPFDSEGLTGDTVTDLGDGGGEELPPFLADQLLGDASFRLAMTLPGRPIEHNATSVDGNTFVWDVDLANPPDRFFARTEPGVVGDDDGFPWGIVLAVLAGLGIIAAIVLLVRHGSKTFTDPKPPGGDAPSAGAGMPTGPPAGAPPQPVFDAALNAWVVDDPERGRFRHDPASGQWIPLEGPPPT